MPSSVAASLISTPCRAPIPVPTATAVGVASPRASGQAMTTALMAKVSAMSRPWSESSIHPAKVRSPAETATMTSTAAARSARRWPGAFELWARSTSSMIWPRAVSAPILVARTVSVPERLIAPPTTSSPTRFSTGMDSPVMRLSSSALWPEVTTPSTGTLSPGRSRISSPTTISAFGTSTSCPSRITRAVGGTMSNIARRASLVPRRLLISIQCPKSTKVTSMAAASKNVSRPSSVSSTLAPQAVSTPTAISTDMLSWRWRSDVPAPPMKIQPAYQTIGVERTSMMTFRAFSEPISSRSNVLTAMGENRMTGMVRARATKKRRRMSRSMAAAMAGSDMSCDMPSCPPASTAGSRCSWDAAVCGSSYCMRSHLVPQVIGAICAWWASSAAVGPPGSPAQR